MEELMSYDPFLEDDEEYNDDDMYLQALVYGGTSYVSIGSMIGWLAHVYEETDAEELELFLVSTMADLDILHDETVTFFPDLNDMIDPTKLAEYMNLQKNAEEKNG